MVDVNLTSSYLLSNALAPALVLAFAFVCCCSSMASNMESNRLELGGGNETDRLALLAIKAQIHQDPNRPVMSSWNESTHFCMWYGVTCSRRHLQRVTKLDLSSLKLLGSISPHIGNLSFLRELHLYENSLTNIIPPKIGHLRRLQILHLGNNSLSGPIPANISNCFDLRILAVYNNKLVGNIPPQLGSLSKLEYLGLQFNKLTGEIPPSLGNLSSLDILGARQNNLVGSIPSSLGQLKKLTVFVVEHNRLSGTIPPSIYNISSLVAFAISDNQIQGSMPPSLFRTLPNLQFFSIFLNQFTGSFPLSISNATNLVVFQVNDNELKGQISPQICNLTQLSDLDLSRNKLSGMLPQCLGPGLRYLKLANNSFYGILPQTFPTTGCNLSMIDVSHNKLQGQLPRSLANCASLEFLVLSNNQFDDVFPLWLGTLQKLKILAMCHNGFYGVIGQPKKNLHFPELRILDLSYNSFKGKFPAEYIFSGYAIRGLSSVKSSYHSYDHYLQCSISITNKGTELNYPKIQEDFVAIHLSSNKFEGNIPEFIGKLKGLRLLNISNNFFTGCIPSSFGNLTMLESLDLSQNQLSGVIPQQLSQLFFLEIFNVSHNNLTGRIPGGPQLSTFDVTSYERNPGLCGDPLPKKCENPEGINLPPSTSNPDGSGIEVDWKFALAGLGSGLVVGVVLADVAITRWDEWFLEVVDMLIRLVTRIRRCRK